MDKCIYNMKLHDIIYITDDLSYTRVPGGWLVQHWSFQSPSIAQGVFVPYDNEYQLSSGIG